MRRKFPQLAVRAGGWLLSLMLAPALWSHAGLCKLTVLQAPTLIVDPTCSTCDGASVVLQLRNDGSQMVKLDLTAGEFKNRAGGLLAPKPQFTPLTGLQNGEVAPRQVVKVQMEVRNVLEEGEWEADINNRGVSIGHIKVIRTHLPLVIRLDVPNPDQPEVSVLRCTPAHLGLKNDDAISYPLGWQLTLEGRNGSAPTLEKEESKTESATRNQASQGAELVSLPAKGQAQVSFIPPNRWFYSPWSSPCGWLCAVLKNDDVRGHLMVRLRPLDCTGCSASPDRPAKSFSILVHLSYYSKNCQDWLGTLIVIGVLLIGALFSVVVNFVIPNERRRTIFKRQLNELDARIGGLPVALASRLRVVAAMELRNILARAERLSWSNPERDTLAAEIPQDLQSLSRRVDLLEKLGELRTRFEDLRVLAQPPTLIDELEDLFEQSIEILQNLKLTEDQLAAATTNISRIENSMRTFGQANPDLVRSLADRATQLKQDFAAGLGQSPNLEHVREALPGLFAQYSDAPEKAEGYSPAKYAEWDMILYKLRLVEGYVRLLDARSPDDPTYEKIRNKGTDLLGYLKTFSSEALGSARRLVREMREDIFREEIEGRIRERRLTIEWDRSEIRRFEPVQFSLRFNEPAYNSAAAKDEWTCTWDFGHPPNLAWKGPQRNMTETGWTVSHYFPKAQKYDIHVSFRHEREGELAKTDGGTEPATLNATVTVGPEKGEMGTTPRYLNPLRGVPGGEFARFALALGPALLALVAGAKEQVLKMDCVPALIAIFLVGFGSDQVKNLLTQQKQ
jgi:hypothetical protein